MLVVFVVVGALSFAALRVLRARAPATSSQTNGTAPESDEKKPALRPVTRAELSAATGETGCELYIAVKDPYSDLVTVFDVSPGVGFYGPGGSYHVFAGKDATHGLAKSSIDPAMATGDISKLTAVEKDTHMQWYAKYISKYRQVGWLVDEGATDDNAVGSTTTVETFAETESEAKKDV